MTSIRTTMIRRTAALTLALAATAGVAACSSSTKASPPSTTDATTTTTPASTTSSTSTTPATTVAGGNGTDQHPGGTPGGDSESGSGSGSGSGKAGSGSGGSGGTTPGTATPVITSFQTPDSVDCHNGNLQNYTVSWATQHTTKVTLSLDGPGIYDTYGPSGDASLPFNCSSAHTVLITAYGADGTTTTRQVTLQPRNAQSSTTIDPNP